MEKLWINVAGCSQQANFIKTGKAFLEFLDTQEDCSNVRIRLIREPDNPYDPRAILVKWMGDPFNEGQGKGYLGRVSKHNLINLHKLYPFNKQNPIEFEIHAMGRTDRGVLQYLKLMALVKTR